MIRLLFDLVKFLIRGGYKHTKNGHCGDSKLLAIIEDFKQQKFAVVKEKLLQFSDDYREFAFKSLGEIKDSSIFENWIKEAPNDDLPLVALANHKVIQGWEIRGVNKVSSVSKEDLARFKSLLEEAKEILLKSKKITSEFDINKDICLLTLFKAIDLESRAIIHETFQHGLAINPQHIGLHIAYFVAISEKWGGSREELNAYFKEIPNEPALLGQCVLAIYYWDLIKVYSISDSKTEENIRNFIFRL